MLDSRVLKKRVRSEIDAVLLPLAEQLAKRVCAAVGEDATSSASSASSAPSAASNSVLAADVLSSIRDLVVGGCDICVDDADAAFDGVVAAVAGIAGPNSGAIVISADAVARLEQRARTRGRPTASDWSHDDGSASIHSLSFADWCDVTSASAANCDQWNISMPVAHAMEIKTAVSALIAAYSPFIIAELRKQLDVWECDVSEDGSDGDCVDEDESYDGFSRTLERTFSVRILCWIHRYDWDGDAVGGVAAGALAAAPTGELETIRRAYGQLRVALWRGQLAATVALAKV